MGNSGSGGLKGGGQGQAGLDRSAFADYLARRFNLGTPASTTPATPTPTSTFQTMPAATPQTYYGGPATPSTGATPIPSVGTDPNNPYAGLALPQQVQSAYTNALGQAGGLSETGAGFLDQVGGNTTNASGIFNALGQYQPQQIDVGQLATTDLSPYMNPYTQNVIDTTMGELNRQEAMQQERLAGQSVAEGAFGGDRFALQGATMNRDFDTLRKNTIADLYSKNFLNAQQMGQFDINAMFGKDQANQNADIAGASVRGQAGQGLTGLAGILANAGIDLSKAGVSSLGNLANMGFGFGNDLQKNQLAMGALQQTQNQQVLDAIRAQVSGQTGAPMNMLQQYLASILNPGSYGTSTTTTSGSGQAIQGIGTLLQGVGAILPGSYTGAPVPAG